MTSGQFPKLDAQAITYVELLQLVTRPIVEDAAVGHDAIHVGDNPADTGESVVGSSILLVGFGSHFLVVRNIEAAWVERHPVV